MPRCFSEAFPAGLRRGIAGVRVPGESSDAAGAAQPVGEIVDLLAREAPLDWVWILGSPRFAGATPERELWFLPKER